MKLSIKYVVERNKQIVFVCDNQQLADLFKTDGDEVRAITFVSETEDNKVPLTTIPELPTIPLPELPAIPNPFGPISKCSKCGLDLYQTMGYCCPRLDCPTGLGPTICSVSSESTIPTIGCGGCGSCTGGCNNIHKS